MTQKFFKGDLVRVGDMPISMSHFSGNCDAIVIGTYAERYGAGARGSKQYTLYILKHGDRGEVSWYDEDQLTFVEADRFDLLPAGNVHRKLWEAKQQRMENT